MSSTSSGRRRSSKNKDKVDAVEFAALVTQLSRLRMRMLPGKGKYKGDVDQVSDLLSELSISESKNLSSKQKRALNRLLRLPPDKKAMAIAKAMMEESSEEEEEEEEDDEDEDEDEEEEKQEKESTSEMPISDFRAVASQKKPEEKLHFMLGLKDLENLRDRCKNPRAPELVEKDPEGKLFPLDFKKDSNGFYEVPPGVTCEVCGSSYHWRTLCPYLHKFPPGGEIKNKEAYQVVCRCGNAVVDLSRQSCDNCISGTGCHVVHKDYPIFVNSIYSKHLHNLISQRARNNIGEKPAFQPDPSNGRYVPGRGFVDK